MRVLVLSLLCASVQLGAAFVPHLAPTQISGRGIISRATSSRLARTPYGLSSLKAQDTDTAISEFSGTDAAGKQVHLNFKIL